MRSRSIYKNSRQVEVLDPETFEPVDTFASAARFCEFYGKSLNKASDYLTDKNRRKINGMIAQYAGDDYWMKKMAGK
jgi:hypothetical protein